MSEMSGVQSIIYDALEDLLEAVEEGKFGEGDDFDRDAFEGEFDDEVLVLAYVYEKDEQRDEKIIR